MKSLAHAALSVARLRVALVLAVTFSYGCASDHTAPIPPGPDTHLELELASNAGDVDVTVFVRGAAGTSTVAFDWQLTDESDRLARSVPPLDNGWTRVEGHFAVLDAIFARHDADAEFDRVRLWVRNVDARGEVDPSPAFATLTRDARLVPEPLIDFPMESRSSSCAQVSRSVAYSWRVDSLTEADGISTRHAWVRVGRAEDPCLTREEFEALDLTTLVGESDWTEWIAFDPGAPRLDATRSARLDARVFPDAADGDSYLLLVQGRDDAGQAMSRTFDWVRNVRYFRVTEGHLPELRIVGNDFTVRTVTGRAPAVQEIAPAGATFDVGYLGEASAYSGYVSGYRWGVNVDDPDDPTDSGWLVPWQMLADRSAPDPEPFAWTLVEGANRLVLAVMDNSGTVSRAVFDVEAFTPLPMAERRPLLLVMDASSSTSGLVDEWRTRWVEHLQAVVPEFEPVLDVIDARAEPERVVPSTVYGYRGVVWFVHSPQESWVLEHLSGSSDAVPLNWLSVYQRFGNLLLVGAGVVQSTVEAARGLVSPVDFRAEVPQPPGGGGVPLYPIDFPWGERQWVARGFGVQASTGVQYFDGPTNALCDGLVRADVSAALGAAFPATSGRVLDLVPRSERVDTSSAAQRLGAAREEVYDSPVRSSALEPKPFQIPMFVHRARRDVAPEAITGACPNGEAATGRSWLDGRTNGLLSRAYADLEPTPGAVDALWGFNPMGFTDESVRAALDWLIGENWGLATVSRMSDRGERHESRPKD